MRFTLWSAAVSGLAEGDGNAGTGQTAWTIDRDLVPGTTYYWRVGSVRLTPRQYALFANFPNPFNPSTSIEYALPDAAEVELAVYDILGQKVQTLVAHELQGAGYYRLTWDGRNYAGRSVASGLYFYRLATPEFVQTRKMTLIK